MGAGRSGGPAAPHRPLRPERSPPGPALGPLSAGNTRQRHFSSSPAALRRSGLGAARSPAAVPQSAAGEGGTGPPHPHPHPHPPLPPPLHHEGDGLIIYGFLFHCCLCVLIATPGFGLLLLLFPSDFSFCFVCWFAFRFAVGFCYWCFGFLFLFFSSPSPPSSWKLGPLLNKPQRYTTPRALNSGIITERHLMAPFEAELSLPFTQGFHNAGRKRFRGEIKKKKTGKGR